MELFLIQLFFKLFNISIAASFLILAVALFRLVFKKAPKKILCVLWAIVGLRLLLPFSLESKLSLVPRALDLGVNTVVVGIRITASMSILSPKEAPPIILPLWRIPLGPVKSLRRRKANPL